MSRPWVGTVDEICSRVDSSVHHIPLWLSLKMYQISAVVDRYQPTIGQKVSRDKNLFFVSSYFSFLPPSQSLLRTSSSSPLSLSRSALALTPHLIFTSIPGNWGNGSWLHCLPVAPVGKFMCVDWCADGWAGEATAALLWHFQKVFSSAANLAPQHWDVLLMVNDAIDF